jgi:hypothetical protein
MTASDKNLSTEHQPKGSATNLSDTLDRQGETVPAGQRQWAGDSATKPADTRDLDERDTPAKEAGLGNDAPRSAQGS